MFLITGGASGLGFQLASILYHADATVYIAGRSDSDALAAISQIKSDTNTAPTPAKGRLEFLHLDLADLASVRTSAAAFRAREARLDVLWNNAGIGTAPGGTKSAQGIEIQFATNCVGPLLFTRLLLPCLRAAAIARAETPGAVRVIWSASMVVDLSAPPGGIDVDSLDNPPRDGVKNYEASKVGNWFLASELAREEQIRDGPSHERVLHLVANPGSLRTRIWRYYPWLLTKILELTMLHDAKLGAYTVLWAGLAKDIDLSDGGRYVIPWGRWHPSPREDIVASLKEEGEGGNGRAKKFLQWCEKKIKGFDDA